MKTIVLTAALCAVALPAMACMPAPTCWMNSGEEYLKSVCHSVAHNPDALKYVEEPAQNGKFIRACAKLGIRVSQTRDFDGAMVHCPNDVKVKCSP
jgi:hypothetical protein